MAHNAIQIDAAPDAVFAVLADAHTYEDWVVGCQRIRAADDTWPAVGSRFHHRVGLGPVSTADYTEVLTEERPHRLALRARARPLLSAAKVTFSLRAEAGGTEVVMDEGPLSEKARRLWNPVIDFVTRLRNAETLRQLKSLVEARATMDA